MSEKLIEIDGSMGEGGGQILRNAVALSAVLLKPIRVYNIRAKRSNPGLRPQHLTGVKAVAALSSAEVSGLKVGSMEIVFKPRRRRGGRFTFNVGTAGSITLALQTIIPLAFGISKPLSINLGGGTDVKWSPTWNYFKDVFLHILNKIGVDVRADLVRRGFYPKGGGEANVDIYPAKDPESLCLEKQRYEKIDGVIAVSKLREDIPRRIKHSIIKLCLEKSIPCQIYIDRDDESPSEGVSVTLWSSSSDSRIGSSEIGERGLPSEKLGRMMFESIVKEMESGASVDIHLADQILVYLAYISSRYGGKSYFYVREITNHTRTNMWLIEKFLPVKMSVRRERELYRIEIKGI